MFFMLHYFLLLENILMYRYTTFCLAIHLLTHIWIVFTLELLQIVLLGAFVYKFLSEHIFSIVLNIYLGVKLQDHMVILCLIF